MRALYTFFLVSIIGWGAQAQSIQSFTLVNADTDTDISQLTDGLELNLSTLPTTNLNIRANTGPSTVGSVQFILNGIFQIENKAPYALKGDNNGDYHNWTPAVGNHTLHATPYSDSKAGGAQGTSLSVDFTVINQPSWPPTAPGNLIASPLSPTEINLSWDDNGIDEESFVIERSKSITSPFVEFATISHNTTTYIDKSLSDGETVKYRVKAINSAGVSDFSNEVSATTPYGSPHPPTNLVATDLSSSSIYLTWAMPPFGNDYAIERSLTPTNGFTEVDASYYSDCQHTSYGLQPNTPYYFRVKTFFDGQGSAYSEVVAATTEGEVLPEIIYAINAGGKTFTASDGTVFTDDRRFTGGKVYSRSREIFNTEDDPLYQTERYGNFTYEFPVENGQYQLILLFAEIYFDSPNKRIFDVSIEEQERISNLDVYAIVGKNTAHSISEIVEVTDRSLSIAFSSDVNNAKLSGLIIRSATETSPLPTARVREAIATDVNFNPITDSHVEAELFDVAEMVAYPVPLQDHLTISFAKEKEHIFIEFTDFNGIALKQIEAKKQQRVELTVSGLSPGAYYLRVVADGETGQKTLIKSE